MYLIRGKWPSANRKVYKTAYLRESYRVGRQVKTRIVANLTHCSDVELDVIELALTHKGNLAVLGSVENVELVEGLSVGAVWTVYEVARGRGIEKALGKSFRGQLGMWLEVHPEERTLQLCVNEEALKEVSRLDGCYVIKSDLPKDVRPKRRSMTGTKTSPKSRRPFAPAKPSTSRCDRSTCEPPIAHAPTPSSSCRLT